MTKRWWWPGIAALVVVVAVAIAGPVRMARRAGTAAGTQLRADDATALRGARTGTVLLPTGEPTADATVSW